MSSLIAFLAVTAPLYGEAAGVFRRKRPHPDDPSELEHNQRLRLGPNLDLTLPSLDFTLPNLDITLDFGVQTLSLNLANNNVGPNDRPVHPDLRLRLTDLRDFMDTDPPLQILDSSQHLSAERSSDEITVSSFEHDLNSAYDDTIDFSAFTHSEHLDDPSLTLDLGNSARIHRNDAAAVNDPDFLSLRQTPINKGLTPSNDFRQFWSGSERGHLTQLKATESPIKLNPVKPDSDLQYLDLSLGCDATVAGPSNAVQSDSAVQNADLSLGCDATVAGPSNAVQSDSAVQNADLSLGLGSTVAGPSNAGRPDSDSSTLDLSLGQHVTEADDHSAPSLPVQLASDSHNLDLTLGQDQSVTCDKSHADVTDDLQLNIRQPSPTHSNNNPNLSDQIVGLSPNNDNVQPVAAHNLDLSLSLDNSVDQLADPVAEPAEIVLRPTDVTNGRTQSLSIYADLSGFIADTDILEYLRERVPSVTTPPVICEFIGQQVDLSEINYLAHVTTTFDQLLCIVSMEQKVARFGKQAHSLLPIELQPMWRNLIIPVTDCFSHHPNEDLDQFSQVFGNPFRNNPFICPHNQSPPQPLMTLQLLPEPAPSLQLLPDAAPDMEDFLIPLHLVYDHDQLLDYPGRLFRMDDKTRTQRLRETAHFLTRNIPDEFLAMKFREFLNQE